MNDSTDKRDFSDLLRGTFDAYSRPMPLAATQIIWWNLCRPHPIDAVRNAFGRYVATEPKFPPTPAQILAFMGEGTGDERPGADEAWNTALQASDERATVVWTAETAQAFESCRTILDSGDQIGARMAFRQAYDRLVVVSRRDRLPVSWSASLGADPQQRALPIERAVVAGLLPQEQAKLLLPPPETPTGPTRTGLAALAQLRAVVENVTNPMVRASLARSRANATARIDDDHAKALAEQRVRDYQAHQA